MSDLWLDRRDSQPRDIQPHLSDMHMDQDGWFVPRCTCGWQFGPVSDGVTAIDALMVHAYDVGSADYVKLSARS